jgi:hypothetical protein
VQHDCRDETQKWRGSVLHVFSGYLNAARKRTCRLKTAGKVRFSQNSQNSGSNKRQRFIQKSSNTQIDIRRLVKVRGGLVLADFDAENLLSNGIVHIGFLAARIGLEARLVPAPRNLLVHPLDQVLFLALTKVSKLMRLERVASDPETTPGTAR